MNTKAELYKIIYDGLKARLVPLGYKPCPKCFCKEFNGLLYAVALYKLPNSAAGELWLNCETCVYSAEMDIKLGKQPDPVWPSSQIRVRLNTFRPKVPGFYQPPLTCRSPEEAVGIEEQIWKLLSDKALPIIESVRSTDDMLPLLRESPHTLKSTARARYDADVWEGKIDPKLQPFVPAP